MTVPMAKITVLALATLDMSGKIVSVHLSPISGFNNISIKARALLYTKIVIPVTVIVAKITVLALATLGVPTKNRLSLFVFSKHYFYVC